MYVRLIVSAGALHEWQNIGLASNVCAFLCLWDVSEEPHKFQAYTKC